MSALAKTPITKCPLCFSNRIHHEQNCGLCIGYYVGGANDQQIDGTSTVKFLRDVIVVVPNWRSVYRFRAWQGVLPCIPYSLFTNSLIHPRPHARACQFTYSHVATDREFLAIWALPFCASSPRTTPPATLVRPWDTTRHSSDVLTCIHRVQLYHVMPARAYIHPCRRTFCALIAGFQDQQLAMQWMHDNIEHFSGDPRQRMTQDWYGAGLEYGGGAGVDFSSKVLMTAHCTCGMTQSRDAVRGERWCRGRVSAHDGEEVPRWAFTGWCAAERITNEHNYDIMTSDLNQHQYMHAKNPPRTPTSLSLPFVVPFSVAGLFTRAGIESGAFVPWGWMPMHVAQVRAARWGDHVRKSLHGRLTRGWCRWPQQGWCVRSR